MKFKIGDRVQTKLNRTLGTVRRIRDGMVAVETDDTSKGVPLPIFDIQRGLFLSEDAWEKISPSKIVITSDGKTTLARLYDCKRVIRRAEAKCSPEDTYDFATGANLAYDRLMRPETLTASVKPYAEPDKSTTLKYKVGDKITARGTVCGISGPGTIVEVDAKSSLCNYCVSFDVQPGARIWAYTGSVESLAEPARPTTPANKYDAMSDDDLVCAVCGMGLCSAATSGIRHADCPFKNTPAYNSPTVNCTDFLHAHPEFRPVLVQYLADEDAAKEPKPEPKPVKHLYSGKVVCVETHDDFTVGKVYTFKDGKVTDDSWTRRPMSSFVAESLEDWNSRYCYSVARFVEYKGEA